MDFFDVRVTVYLLVGCVFGSGRPGPVVRCFATRVWRHVQGCGRAGVIRGTAARAAPARKSKAPVRAQAERHTEYRSRRAHKHPTLQIGPRRTWDSLSARSSRCLLSFEVSFTRLMRDSPEGRCVFCAQLGHGIKRPLEGVVRHFFPPGLYSREVRSVRELHDVRDGR